MNKYSEIFWEKVGAIAIAALIGAIYGIIASPVIIYLAPQVTLSQVVKVFCLVFSCIGFFSSQFLIQTALGAIYTITGFFAGLGAVRSVSAEQVRHFRRMPFWFTLIGFL